MRPFSLSDQQRAIAADWTSFRIVSEGPWWTTWEGVLTPNKTSYRVQLPGGELLQVDRHGAGHDAHQAGDAVLLSLDPEATLLLAR